MEPTGVRFSDGMRRRLVRIVKELRGSEHPLVNVAGCISLGLVIRACVERGLPVLEKELRILRPISDTELKKVYESWLELYEDNERLANEQCLHPEALVGDEGGTPICKYWEE